MVVPGLRFRVAIATLIETLIETLVATLVETWSSTSSQGCDSIRNPDSFQNVSGLRIAIETLFATLFATLIATIEKPPGLRILGPSGCDSGLRIETLIETLIATLIETLFATLEWRSPPVFQSGLRSGLQFQIETIATF